MLAWGPRRHRRLDVPVDPQARADRPNLEGYDVLADGAVVGRIFLSPAAPEGRHRLRSPPQPHARRAATRLRGYAAMAAFKKSWRRE
jgi:hypothetical protein